MIIIRGDDGGWTPAPDDGAGRFAVHTAETSVELEDRDTGERRAFPGMVEALISVCELCDDENAPCRKKCADEAGVTPDSA